jgi:hypothetical protein
MGCAVVYVVAHAWLSRPRVFPDRVEVKIITAGETNVNSDQ